MTLKLTFLGAAGTVTGSKYALTDGKHTLLVDCGLFQGPRQWARELNRWIVRDPRSARAYDARGQVLLTRGNLKVAMAARRLDEKDYPLMRGGIHVIYDRQ